MTFVVLGSKRHSNGAHTKLPYYIGLTLINLTHAFFNLDFFFRRLLLGTSILQATEGGTTTMIEATTMVTEKGTGIGIQKHEPLAETTIAIKMTSRVRGWTG